MTIADRAGLGHDLLERCVDEVAVTEVDETVFVGT